MNKRIIWVQYLGFCLVGLVANVAGPSLAAIRTTLQLNYSQAGLILSGQFFGMLFAVLFGGYISDRFGKKPFIMAGSLFLTLGLVGSMLAGSYLFLLLAVAVTGIGYGAYAVGINALCADYGSGNQGRAMNLLHFFFGIGAIAGPILVTIGLDILRNWRPVFGLVGLFPLVIAAILWPVRPKQPRVLSQTKSAGPKPFQTGFLWMMGLTILMYQAVEVSVYGWLPSLWKVLFGSGSPIPPSLTTTFFWLALTMGRLVAGWLSDRIGLSRYLILTALGVMLITILWWATITTVWGIAAVFMIGFFLAGIFPTIMAVSTARFPNQTGQTAGFIITFAALGGFLTPSGVGRFADVYGLSKLPLLVGGLATLMVMGVIYAWRLGKRSCSASGLTRGI